MRPLVSPKWAFSSVPCVLRTCVVQVSDSSTLSCTRRSYRARKSARLLGIRFQLLESCVILVHGFASKLVQLVSFIYISVYFFFSEKSSSCVEGIVRERT